MPCLEEVRWKLEAGQEPMFAGTAYTYGSRKGNTEHAMDGWSAAGMDGMEPRVVAYGPLPTQLPVQRKIKRVDMWGFLQLLRFAQPPIRAVTDHLGILQGLERGEAGCAAVGQPHADVWRLGDVEGPRS